MDRDFSSRLDAALRPLGTKTKVLISRYLHTGDRDERFTEEGIKKIIKTCKTFQTNEVEAPTLR